MGFEKNIISKLESEADRLKKQNKSYQDGMEELSEMKSVGEDEKEEVREEIANKVIGNFKKQEKIEEKVKTLKKLKNHLKDNPESVLNQFKDISGVIKQQLRIYLENNNDNYPSALKNDMNAVEIFFEIGGLLKQVFTENEDEVGLRETENVVEDVMKYFKQEAENYLINKKSTPDKVSAMFELIGNKEESNYYRNIELV